MKILLLAIYLSSSISLMAVSKKDLKRDLKHLRQYVSALEEEIDNLQLALIYLEEERQRELIERKNHYFDASSIGLCSIMLLGSERK